MIKPQWSDELEQLVLQEIIDQYPHTSPPTGMGSKSEFIIYEDRIDDIIDFMVIDKSTPGYPWMCSPLHCGTNRQVIETYRTELKIEVINLLLRYFIHEFDTSESLYYQHLYPARAFVKNEGHKKSKLEIGRYRIIDAVSLQEQIVDRYLFEIQNNTEISRWYDIPSSPGFGFDTEEQISQIINNVPWGCDLLSTDMSFYDWQNTLNEYKREANMRVSLAQAHGTAFEIVVHNRLRNLAIGLLYTPSGNVFVQKIAGKVKSGMYITGSMNSRQRASISFAVQLMQEPNIKPWARTMGDDCFEKSLPDSEKLYEMLGFRIKDPMISSTHFDFCSQRFSRESLIGTNPTKPLFHLLTNPRLNKQMLFDYLNHPGHDPDNLPRICHIIYTALRPVTSPELEIKVKNI